MAATAQIGRNRGQVATGVRRGPDQRDRQPNLRQVGESIGLGLAAKLHQPNDRHQHPDVPQPADQQVRALPPPPQRRRRDGGQQQDGRGQLAKAARRAGGDNTGAKPTGQKNWPR